MGTAGPGGKPGGGCGHPRPPRQTPRAPGPCVGCFDSVPEPSLGKPRRTGRHSSFYRPSNWGWSRRGNTKILCTQLCLRVPGSSRIRRTGHAFVLFRGSAPSTALFLRGSLMCRPNPGLLSMGPVRTNGYGTAFLSYPPGPSTQSWAQNPSDP